MAENDAPELKIVSMIWAREAGVRVCVYENEQNQRVIEIHGVVDRQSQPLAKATIELSKRDEFALAVAKSAFEEDLELLQSDNERLRDELKGLYAKMLRGEIVDAARADLAAPDAAQKAAEEIQKWNEHGQSKGSHDADVAHVESIILNHFMTSDAVRQARRETWKKAIEIVSTEIAVGNKRGPFPNSDQIKAVIGYMKAAALRAEGEEREK